MKKKQIVQAAILQTDICEKKNCKKGKYEKYTCYFKVTSCTNVSSKENTPIELPKLKRNK